MPNLKVVNPPGKVVEMFEKSEPIISLSALLKTGFLTVGAVIYPMPLGKGDIPPPQQPPPGETEQYALRAKVSGDYPVLNFGNANLFWNLGIVTQTAHQDANQAWKYGTTINPLSRYTLTKLEKLKLRYEREFKGPEQAAVMLESMKIINHAIMYGAHPYGNTKNQ